jgi:hypothetical protein
VNIKTAPTVPMQTPSDDDLLAAITEGDNTTPKLARRFYGESSPANRWAIAVQLGKLTANRTVRRTTDAHGDEILDGWYVQYETTRCDNGLCPNEATRTVTIDGFAWRACEACADGYATKGCDITTDEAA